MAAPFEFAHRVAFLPENAESILREVPAAPGVFALRGPDPAAEPYLTRAADLRRRMRRLLAPPEALDAEGKPVFSRRLNLRERVRSIEYTRTGSEFESTLTLYRASLTAFGPAEACRRLRLHTPYFVRVTLSHAHPRVYITNRLSQRSMPECFGPFPSRAAAERSCDAVLDLFLIRRCHEDLAPHPEHPGCVYGEMKKCLQPCKEACTPAQYAQEATRIAAFFRTRGQSLLDEVAAEREAASEAMDFERAAALHKQWEKVRAASLLADELVRPVAGLRAVILQETAPQTATALDSTANPALNAAAPHLASPYLASPMRASTEANAAVFLLDHGHLLGPAPLSTLGVRAVREQTAVGSSLFAQPLMLSAVPLEEPSSAASPNVLSPEDRARQTLNLLEAATHSMASLDEFCDALSLFRRWYYRPEKQRAGEVFLPNLDGEWPIRRILNGAARVVLGPPASVAPVDRDAAKLLKTKIIHAGREGVEREVPVLPKRTRSRKALTPADVVSDR